MGLFWIAAAAAASKKLKSRHGRSRPSKPEETSHNSNSYSYDVKHSYYDCVVAELGCKSGEDLNAFFQKIVEEYQSVINVDIQEKIVQLDKKTNELIEFEDRYGVKHSRSNFYANPTYIFDEITKSFDGDNYIASIISDIKNTNGDYVRFGNRLNYEISSLEDRIKRYEAEIPEMEHKIKDYKRKKIFYVLDRDFWDGLLYKETGEYIKTQKYLESDKAVLKAYKYYYKLYSENSELLKKCFDKYIEYSTINSERDSIERYIYKLKRISSGEEIYETDYQEKKLSQALDNLIQSGKITDIELQKVFLLLDKVEIKGRRGEYNFSYYRDNKSKLMKFIVEWFISNVYELDENFVDRNYYIQEEENTAPKLT